MTTKTEPNVSYLKRSEVLATIADHAGHEFILRAVKKLECSEETGENVALKTAIAGANLAEEYRAALAAEAAAVLAYDIIARQSCEGTDEDTLIAAYLGAIAAGGSGSDEGEALLVCRDRGAAVFEARAAKRAAQERAAAAAAALLERMK